jgi:hypothetical protein
MEMRCKRERLREMREGDIRERGREKGRDDEKERGGTNRQETRPFTFQSPPSPLLSLPRTRTSDSCIGIK